MPFFSQRLRREGERTNKEGVDATKTRALSKEKALVMFSGHIASLYGKQAGELGAVLF